MTLLAATVLLLILILVYGLFAKYIRQNFYHRLGDRALIIAQLYLEKDELTRRSFLEIQERSLLKLADEHAYIFDEGNQQVYTTEKNLLVREDILAAIRQQGRLDFAIQDLQGTGISYQDNQGDFVVVVLAQNLSGHQHRRQLLSYLAIAYLVGLLLLFLLGKQFAARALTPIVNFNRKLEKIRAGGLDQRVSVPDNKDEINALATRFNELLDHLEQSFEMQRSFVNNASHELRTPLTAMMGEMEVLLNRERTGEEYREGLRSTLSEIEKLTEVLNRLFEISRLEKTGIINSLQEMTLLPFLEKLRQQWETKFPGSRLSIVTGNGIDSTLLLRGNPVLLETAMNNIIGNAFKFSAGQPVEVQVELLEGGVQIRVIDQGIGIPDEDREKMFERFYRGSNAGSFPGTGIGLSIARSIIHWHKGSVYALPGTPGGSIFNIHLPVEGPL